MDNQLNILNTQELVNDDDDKNNKDLKYMQDDFDSNSEDNPNNEYPDEEDEFERDYNIRLGADEEEDEEE